MTRDEFLGRLGELLACLPAEQVEETKAFYAEAIADRMEDGMSEEEAVAAMGTPGEVAEATARTFRGEVEYEMIWGAPPVISDPEMAALAADCAREVVGESRVIDHVDAPNMGGEDFAYFLNQVPGAFMFLSSSNPEKHTDVPHHNPRFNVDEDVLWIGSAMFVKIVERFLEIE